MTISIRRNPNDKILELGGGACPLVRPNADVRQCWDAQGNATVDFQIDFEKPLPIQSDEWDGVFSRFAIEHVSFPKVPEFLREVYRILKPGGKFVCVTANTAAQIEWLTKNPNGWDGKDFYTSASEILFGSQDYSQNSHRCFFNPEILVRLFQEAGFTNVTTDPYGTRDSDIAVQAVKPSGNTQSGPNVLGSNASPIAEETAKLRAEGLGLLHKEAKKYGFTTEERASLFDRHYFDGGTKVGGYKELYRDFVTNWMVSRHVLDRRPESVLEIGAGRGYVLKKLQDVGIRVCGLDISRHAYLTRAIEDLIVHDLCDTPWPIADRSYDLVFSQSCLEHIPEEFLPKVLHEINRVGNRSLHGITFDEADDGTDQTRATLKSRDWWVKLFQEYGVPNPEVYDRRQLEQGNLPLDVANGDGRVKLEIGSFTIMNHFGWECLDVHDLHQFAASQYYRYRQHDIRTGLPYNTGSVDLIHSSHCIEHISAREGVALLRECRRVIRPNGVIRLAFPDAALLTTKYVNGTLGDFDEVNNGAASSPTQAGKLWEFLFSGHQTAYDMTTICLALQESGWKPLPTHFRKTNAGPGGEQILRETLDQLPCISAYVDATPLTG